MMENKEIRALARSNLRGNWSTPLGVVFIYVVIISASAVVGVGPLLITGPLTLGLYCYFIKKVRGESSKFENLFEGFHYFGPSLLLYILQTIYITLWTFLFIIPGVIKSFSYSMSFFILYENTSINASEALKQSSQMMNGYKKKLFFLNLSFFGWVILSILSLGIGFLWLGPYMYMSLAIFYEELKKNQSAQ